MYRTNTNFTSVPEESPEILPDYERCALVLSSFPLLLMQLLLLNNSAKKLICPCHLGHLLQAQLRHQADVKVLTLRYHPLHPLLSNPP